MPNTTIEYLDNLYTATLDRELTAEEKTELLKKLDESIRDAEWILKEKKPARPRAIQLNDLIAKLKAEISNIKAGIDPLCHYSLIRPYMDSNIAWLQAGCPEEDPLLPVK